MDDADLARELERVRTALTQSVDQPQDFELLRRAMDLHMRAAWLSIALGRYKDAIREAREASRMRDAAKSMAAPSPYGGTVLWVACEATAVAYLARGRWSKAEKAARRALRDFDEHDGCLRAYRIARRARGKPQAQPDVAARELAEFDARDCAIEHLRAMPGLA